MALAEQTGSLSFRARLSIALAVLKIMCRLVLQLLCRADDTYASDMEKLQRV
jgi:hypothetical protein